MLFRSYKILEPYLHRKILWKVIREGNYTSFPGFYGFLFRNCNTLPLATNFQTMKKFMRSVDVLLAKKQKILVYAEQGMWWNYRKPRPMTNGAFKFAVSNNVPVLPIFITMNDSEFTGPDGFPVQEYTVHILPSIMADKNLSSKENVEYLKNKNFDMWKEVYENTYNKPLEYLKKAE